MLLRVRNLLRTRQLYVELAEAYKQLREEVGESQCSR